MAVSEATSDRALVVGTGGVAAPPVARRGVRATLREELAEHWFAYALVLPSFLVLAVMIGYPVVNTFISAFSRVDPVGNIISVGTFANFRRLADDPYLPRILGQTVIYTFATVGITTVISFVLALVLNQKFPGRTLAKSLLLLAWAAPLSVSVILWRWIFHGQLGAFNYVLMRLGFIDEYRVWLGEPRTAMAAAIYVEVWSSLPFVTITLLAGLQSVPRDIYDAAKMDGAHPLREFLDMTLPLMKPITFIATLLSVIYAFNSFTVIWIFTKGDPAYRTDIIVTYLYKLAFVNLDFGAASALAVVTFVLLIVFSVTYSRVYLGRRAR
ncbi:MAG TPA: sugar ABC transporter permease [Thermomicrobiales bacterium]|nr:sugar ABC transporter permease [Thermomicrobiales bacterium]